MEKKIIIEDIQYQCDWMYGVSIAKIKKDIEQLEKLGATDIEIDAYEDHGDLFISINVEKRRLETDEEHNQRLERTKTVEDWNKKNELELLKKLKQKYPDA